jgi:two-component system sensor histidine kinase MtrB
VTRRHRWFGRLGLRARLMAAFTVGVFALSGVLMAVTYGVARNELLDQREQVALRQAYFNARVVRDALRTSDPDVNTLLSSLETQSGSLSVLRHRSRWFASSPLQAGRDDVPAALRRRAGEGVPARQSFILDGTPQLGVAVPIPAVDALYFELFSLEELDRTLRILGLSLLGAAAVTTLAGMAVGRWASGRVLRPLRKVADASVAIASGRLDTRVDVAGDPDLVTLADAFNGMAGALQERVERDARFASDVSHELRSPLTTLSTSLEVLRGRRDELPERAQAALDLLSSDVERFQRMVEDLLEISRFDAGVVRLDLEDVRLGELVLHAVTAAPDEDFPIELEAGVSDQLVRADKRRLERVIANLVDNARTHGGGVARVAVEQSNGAMRVLVEDAGPGVPAEEREQIFERFARGSAAGRRAGGGGSGLGLALVAEHVRLHGGRVWVEDRGGAGSGARFVVELPLAET